MTSFSFTDVPHPEPPSPSVVPHPANHPSSHRKTTNNQRRQRQATHRRIPCLKAFKFGQEDMTASSSRVTMKLLIDSKSKKVIFAEAGKETIDFLFHILALPIGSVIRLLTPKGMAGSLGNLYESLENLDEVYIQPNQKKDTLLKPACDTSVPLLLITNNPIERQFYKCPNHSNNVTDDPQTRCPGQPGYGSVCGYAMNTNMTYIAPPAENHVVASGGGLVKGVLTYMVLDDLVVKPMSTISSITLLNQFNIKDVGVLKEKVVTLGMDEALKLLKTSLQSKNVLTSVFMDNANE